MLPTSALAAPAQAPTSEVFELDLEGILQLDIETIAASLLPERTIESSSTVSVILPQNWRPRGARFLSEALRIIPNLVVYKYMYDGQATAIRGFTNSYSGAGVAFLVDGLPVNDLETSSALYNLSDISLELLNRVDVVRGPASAVYGADAFHGVVSLETFRLDHDALEAGTELGSDLSLRSYARMSQGFGALRFNLAVAHFHRADQQRPFRFGNRDKEPGDDLPAVLESTRALSRERLGITSQSEFVAGKLKVNASFGTVFKNAEGSFALPDGTLKGPPTTGLTSNFSYGRLKFDLQASERVGVETIVYGWWRDGTRQLTLGDFDFRNSLSHHRFGIRSLARFKVPILDTDMAAGVQFDTNGVGDDANTRASFGGRFQTIKNLAAGISRLTYSAFLSGSSTLLSSQTFGQLQLAYGARVDRFDDQDAAFPGIGNQFSPRLGLVYLVTPDWAVKTLWGRAFLPPSTTQQYGDGPVGPALGQLSAEIIDTFELVLHGKSFAAFDCRLTLYTSFWSDAIIPVVNSEGNADDGIVGSIDRRNEGENRSYGSELEIQGVVGNLSYTASASVQKSESLTKGFEFGAFPLGIFNADVGYKFFDGFEAHVIHTSLISLNDVPDGFENTPRRLPNFHRLDATLGWSPSFMNGMILQLAARNLLNRRNATASIVGKRSGNPEDPLQVSLGIRAPIW